MEPSDSPSPHLNDFATIIIGNNEEILKHLLLYLPPKSLIRFQSVSKQWLSIISSPTFRHLHSQFCPSTTMTTSCSGTAADSGAFVFIHHKRDRLNFISFHQENASSVGTTVSNLSNFISFQDGQFQDFHYCNGLLALVFQSKDDGHKDFLVYNPTSSQQRHIPRINLLERERRFVALNIVFHPVESDGYKLVCVWSERYMTRNEVSRTPLGRYTFSIYSSETGTWRDTKAINGRDFVYIYFMNGMLRNGDLHWVSGRRETLCFDLDKECLNLTVPSPRMRHSESDIWYFGVSGSCLYLIEVNCPQAPLFNIFELKRDYSEWVLKYQIDLTLLQLCILQWWMKFLVRLVMVDADFVQLVFMRMTKKSRGL